MKESPISIIPTNSVFISSLSFLILSVIIPTGIVTIALVMKYRDVPIPISCTTFVSNFVARYSPVSADIIVYGPHVNMSLSVSSRITLFGLYVFSLFRDYIN